MTITGRPTAYEIDAMAQAWHGLLRKAAPWKARSPFVHGAILDAAIAVERRLADLGVRLAASSGGVTWTQGAAPSTTPASSGESDTVPIRDGKEGA